MESSVRHSRAAEATKAGLQRAKWRYEAGNAIGIIGLIAGLFVMMASPAVGIGIGVLVAGFGVWLAYFS